MRFERHGGVSLADRRILFPCATRISSRRRLSRSPRLGDHRGRCAAPKPSKYRLRHRRRRLGRLRARQPPVRGSGHHACCCSRPAAATAPSDPHAGGVLASRCTSRVTTGRYDDRARAGARRPALCWPRGKVLGGSSSINGMFYIRGHPRDYDDWAAAGARGWGYADVLPYFRRVGDQARRRRRLHGGGGPLHVADQRARNPLYARLRRGGAARPATPRPTTSTAAGRRASAAT